MRVYLAGPVRGEPAPEGSLAVIRQTLESMGHEVVNDLPPPGRSATVQQLDTRTFIAEVDTMLEADLLVADVSSPSHGVGWALAWFLAKGRLAVLCCRRDRKERLSAMLAGNPSPWQRIVYYDGPDDLQKRLSETLRL